MITLNCFTNGFHGQPSTLPPKLPRNVRWVYGHRDFDGITIFEDGHIWSGDVDMVRSRVKVGWLHEPRALHPANYERAAEWRHKFDCILTHDQQLLDAYPDKFRHCIHGGISVPQAMWCMHPKDKTVGMMGSRKYSTELHRFRQRVLHEVEGIDVYWDVYGQAKHDAMKRYRFWVAVENSAEPNWFTEHVLDPLVLGCAVLYHRPAHSEPFGLFRYIDPRVYQTFDSIAEAADKVAYLNAHAESRYEAYRPLLQDNLANLPALEFVEDWMVAHPLREYVT